MGAGAEEPQEAREGDEAEGFLARWSRRKREAQACSSSAEPAPQAQVEAEPPEDAERAETELPPLESLTEDSDYSAFLSPKVSVELQRLALRKLFRSAKFNVRDGLDDYAEDYHRYETLAGSLADGLRAGVEAVSSRLRGAGEDAAEHASADGASVAHAPVREERADAAVEGMGAEPAGKVREDSGPSETG